MTKHEDYGLPPHLNEAPKRRQYWDFPTSWLLGAQLVASLGDIAITALFKFDPRDWMTPGPPIDLTAATTPAAGEESEGCWIDYLSDTGDSPRLVYQLAYLLQQPSLTVHVGDTELCFPGTGTTRPLPRGAALFVGGDTAYPIATRRRLLERFRAPFIWARMALGKAAAPIEPSVPIIGIPGNHDYYNALDGFERQFHQRPPDANIPLAERLAIPGYRNVQVASYAAVRLPHDWEFWALDIETREIDDIQLAYFRDADRPRIEAKRPVSRILATSRPMYVYHGISEHAAEQETSLGKLGIDPAYRDGGTLKDATELRLDLSGDSHLYERYWGTDEETRPLEGTPPSEPTGNDVTADVATPQSRRYASVVSGLGGAFHHPGQVRAKQRDPRGAPRAAWPSSYESSREVGERLLRPRKLFQAGAVGIVGMLVAFLGFWLVMATDGAQNVLDAPFLRAAPMRPLENLGLIASAVLTVVVLGAIVFGLGLFGKRLADPIESMEPLASVRSPVLRGWARATHALTHNAYVFWVLRWLGANRRNVWGVAITAPAWIAAFAIIGLVITALVKCPHFVHTLDGYLPLYFSISVVVFLMVGFGIFVGGKRAGRIRSGVLGLVTGAMIVWSPYAWTRLAMHSIPLGIAGLVIYFPIRYTLTHLTDFLTWPTRVRRFAAVFAWVAILAMYIAIPICVLRGEPVEREITSPLGFVFALIFGGYLACLWVGWYLFLCLQWNGHGNEAGGAARVVNFAEFLRIKLTEDRAEVWVIAVEGPANKKQGLRFWTRSDQRETPPIARLVDHFSIARSSSNVR